MKEELIISGRNNPFIDPNLNIWHLEIPIYLFLGGLAAGILFFASYYYLQGRENDYPTAVKWTPLLVPIFLIVGLIALFLDLKHKLYFWQLYTTIRLESPMSWGAWVLMIITPVSIMWSATYIREFFPKWDWKFKWLKDLEEFFIKKRRILAWILVISSLVLGVYTGILMSAFNARPLWNTSVLGLLFLASGLSSGAALITILSKNPIERKLFNKIDLAIIVIEIFLIIHMFMGFLASTEVQIQAAELFLGGPYTIPIWVFTVFIGIIVPAFLEILELKKFHIPVYIPGILILFGGIMFRIILIYAGQASRYLY